jgi:hypothetical protein
MCFLLGREEEQVAKKVQTPSKPRTAATKDAPRPTPKARKAAPAATAKPAGTRRSTAEAEPTSRAPGAAPAPHPVATATAGNEALDGAVDSLRRLLSELIEQRLESVARDLAEVRRTLAAGGELATGLEQLDDLLDRLGAVRFTAEPLDVVDPLIHTVVAERPGNGAPRGVVLEVVRPGFRSSRGLVLAKAAVAVSAG